MSFGERSPKRQRLEGSYSPASPLPTFDTKPFIPPQTPPPSVRMSPSWTTQSLTAGQQQQQMGSGGGSGSAGGNGAGGASGTTFPTPPSTSGIHSHMAGHGGSESARQTPAADDDVDMGRDDDTGRRDGDGDAEMTDRQAVAVDAEHRRTDHERQGAGGDTAASLTASTSAPTSTSAAPPLLGANVLYRLRTAPIPRSQPHPSHDLFQLYDLKRIQASVARRDPVTGEKINVMRKSYANKVKALGLEGRNKADKNLKELEGLSEPGWNTIVDGERTMFQAHWDSQNMVLGNVDHENDMLRKLDAALQMEPGKLPGKEHDHWKGMLGLDESAAPAAAAKGSVSKFPAGSVLARTAPAMAARNSAPASPRGTIRPDRSGKKRRYNDSSFEGYEHDDDGHLSAGVDDTGRRVSGSKRQKRKDFSPNAIAA